MAEKKSKNGLIVGIVGVVAVAAVIIGVVMANSNKGDGADNNGGGTSQDSTNSGTSQGATVTADELVNAEDVIFVDIDEFDVAQQTSKAIQNGEMTGKVIQFDGYVSHPGVSYSVVEKNEDGTKKIGTVFEIVDADESEYPADDARVFITGKIVETAPMTFTIQTLKEFVKVL